MRISNRWWRGERGEGERGGEDNTKIRGNVAEITSTQIRYDAIN